MHYIFDMGNVLSLNVDVVPAIAAELGIDAAEIAAFSGNDFDELSVGAIDADRYWEAFNRRFGVRVREDLLITRFHPVLDQRVKNLILALKRGGSRVVCGTNTFEKHYLHHLRRGDYDVFDKVYASHLLGVAKPSPEFFLRILGEESWRPGEVVFVDDMPANVRAAADLGIHAVLYTACEDLEALLLGNGD